jgi:hypothetical protein
MKRNLFQVATFMLLIILGAVFLAMMVNHTIDRRSGRMGTGSIIHAPLPLVQHRTEVILEDFRREHDVLGRFLEMMDSLRQDSAGGRRIYDSICRVRPGLLDSAKEALVFYSLYSQIKK